MQTNKIISKRARQGKQIEPVIRDVLINNLISLWLQGKRKRELSSEAILRQIKSEHPNLIDALPSVQTVRRVISSAKNNLENMAHRIDDLWSLGTPDDLTSGIDKDSIPLLLQINKNLASDAKKENKQRRLQLNRLTMREAQWICKLRSGLQAFNEMTAGYTLTAAKIHALTDLGRRYAMRELISKVLGEPLDTHDLDIEIADGIIHGFHSESKRHLELWILSLELGLVPRGSEDRSYTICDPSITLDSCDVREKTNYANIGAPEINKWPNDLWWKRAYKFATTAMVFFEPLNALAMKLEGAGIPFRIRFSTEDWSNNGLRMCERFYTTSADYKITADILRLILPLARIDREPDNTDPDDVKIATAFLKKTFQVVSKHLRDPEVQKVLEIDGH